MNRHALQRLRLGQRVNGSSAVAVVAASLLAACGALPSYSIIPRDVPAPLVVTAEADTKQVSLARTQQLVVKLEANASTFHNWHYEVANDLVLFPSGDTPVFVPTTADDKTGDGMVVYTFRAEGKGATSVKFTYSSSDDKPGEPARALGFQVEAG